MDPEKPGNTFSFDASKRNAVATVPFYALFLPLAILRVCLEFKLFCGDLCIWLRVDVSLAVILTAIVLLGNRWASFLGQKHFRLILIHHDLPKVNKVMRQVKSGPTENKDFWSRKAQALCYFCCHFLSVSPCTAVRLCSRWQIVNATLLEQPTGRMSTLQFTTNSSPLEEGDKCSTLGRVPLKKRLLFKKKRTWNKQGNLKPICSKDESELRDLLPGVIFAECFVLFLWFLSVMNVRTNALLFTWNYFSCRRRLSLSLSWNRMMAENHILSFKGSVRLHWWTAVAIITLCLRHTHTHACFLTSNFVSLPLQYFGD